MDHRPPRPEQPYAWDDERLSAYLDGELSAPEQAQLEARLVVDPDLRQLVDELRAVRQQLEVLPEYRLRATFADQVLRRAEQEMLLSPASREAAAVAAPAVLAEPIQQSPASRYASRRWRRGTIWTAVAAAAVLMLIVTNRTRGPKLAPLARHEVPFQAEPEAATPTKGQPAAAAPVTEPDAKLAASRQPQLNEHGAAEELGIEDRRFEGGGGGGGGAGQGQLAPPKPARQTLQQSAEPLAGNASLKDVPLNKGAAALATQPAATQAAGTMPPASEPFAKSKSANEPAAAAAIAGDAPVPAPGAIAPETTNQADKELAHAPTGKKADATPHLDRDTIAITADARGNSAATGKALSKNEPGTMTGQHRKDLAESRSELSHEIASFLRSEELAKLTKSNDIRFDAASPQEEILVVRLTDRGIKSGERSFESLLAVNEIDVAESNVAQLSMIDRASASATELGKQSKLDAQPQSKAAAGERQGLAPGADANAARFKEFGNAQPADAAQGSTKLKPAEPATNEKSSVSATQDSASEVYYLEAEASRVAELLRQLRTDTNRFGSLVVATRSLPQGEIHDNKLVAPEQSQNPRARGGKPGDAVADGKQEDASPTILGDEFGQSFQHAQAAPTASTPADPAPATSAAPAPLAVGGSEPPARADDGPATDFGPAAMPPANANRGALQADKNPREAAQRNHGGVRAIAYRLKLKSLKSAAEDKRVAELADLSGGSGASGFDAKHGDPMKRSDAAPRQSARDGNQLAAPTPAADPLAANEAAVGESSAKHQESEQIAGPRAAQAPTTADATQEATKKAASPQTSKRVRVLFLIHSDPSSRAEPKPNLESTPVKE